MNRLSLDPDKEMAWLYDYTHPDYNTDRAIFLREARRQAIQSAPIWMRREAELNDVIRRLPQTGVSDETYRLV